MKLRFLAVGDIHLESLSTYLKDEDYLTPVTQTLKQIWTYARENGIEHVFLLGDTFDSPYPRDDAKKAFLQCLDKKLQYHIILGNHDVADSLNNSLQLCKYFIEDLGLMDNVKFHFKPEVVKINGVNFNLLPWPHNKPLSEAPAICMGHFEVKGSISDNGRVFKEGVEPDPKYTWILGHLHRRQGDMYPGSILQHRFGEPANKYFFDVTVNDDNTVTIEDVTINTPYKLLDVVVNSLEDIKLEKQNIYRLFVADHLDFEAVNEAIRGYHIWQIKGLTKDSKGNVELNEADLEFQAQNLADEITYLEKWLSNPDNVDLTPEQVIEAVGIVQSIKEGKI